jgi:pSer/pThr/pTyr-binding forkhead associated (FHA) protein
MPLPGFTITPAIDEAPVPAAAAPVAPVQHSAPATIVLPSGQRLAVTAHAITIGRLPECTIVLNDPNTSRRHAEIRRGLQGTTVVDLGSTNGTKVNGQRITGEHTLAAGDIITVGNTHLRFEAS